MTECSRYYEELLLFLTLPAQGSFLLFLGTHPLLEVVQFGAGLQLHSQLTLILWRTDNIAEEERDIKAARFHLVN